MSTAVFDSSAKMYDVDFTHTSVGKLQRQRVYKYVIPLLNKHTRLLEINCGTGYDAVRLSLYVDQILATDISDEMILVSSAAVEIAGVKNVENKRCSIQELKNKVNEKYNFLFSNFGGLNCLSPSELKQFFNDSLIYTGPSSTLALVLMSKRCWMEDFWFGFKKDPRKGRRNTNSGVKTVITGQEFLTYYYSPHEIQSLAGDNFQVNMIKPIGLFIPPSYLNEYFKKRPIVFGVLKMMDKLFGGLSFMANRADHYLIVLKRK